MHLAGIVKRKVPIRKPLTKARKHLEPHEVDAMVKAARGLGRYGLRHEAAVLLTYRHGMRVEEPVSSRWAHIDRKGATVTMYRKKDGAPAQHPQPAVGLPILGALRREQPDTVGQPMTAPPAERQTDHTACRWNRATFVYKSKTEATP
jgi:type 1 fimbriae regulatory protein FimB/type 1 fimbriae regulatory protein FimE